MKKILIKNLNQRNGALTKELNEALLNKDQKKAAKIVEQITSNNKKLKKAFKGENWKIK